MTVDIVINWAAEGVVLCFVHAIVDLTPRDNDEAQKSGWSDWCGTPTMNTEQLDLLFRRLIVCIPQRTNMNRVFQILASDPEPVMALMHPLDFVWVAPVLNWTLAYYLSALELAGRTSKCLLFPAEHCQIALQSSKGKLGNIAPSELQDFGGHRNVLRPSIFILVNCSRIPLNDPFRRVLRIAYFLEFNLNPSTPSKARQWKALQAAV
jgi:hypothetical protein